MAGSGACRLVCIIHSLKSCKRVPFCTCKDTKKILSKQIIRKKTTKSKEIIIRKLTKSKEKSYNNKLSPCEHGLFVLFSCVALCFLMGCSWVSLCEPSLQALQAPTTQEQKEILYRFATGIHAFLPFCLKFRFLSQQSHEENA